MDFGYGCCPQSKYRNTDATVVKEGLNSVLSNQAKTKFYKLNKEGNKILIETLLKISHELTAKQKQVVINELVRISMTKCCEKSEAQYDTDKNILYEWMLFPSYLPFEDMNEYGCVIQCLGLSVPSIKSNENDLNQIIKSYRKQKSHLITRCACLKRERHRKVNYFISH